jgi:hypothetical protein
MRDTDTYEGFSVMYSVGVTEVWYYPVTCKDN